MNYFSNSQFDIVVPSHRPDMQQETCEHLHEQGFYANKLDGSGYPSFSKLINDCIVSGNNDTVLVCNDKARPTKEEIEKTILLLESGFGFSGLYCFGFFGLHKDLIRTIGFLDENFTGGGYEDCDFMRRCAEKNIAIYQSYEINYLEIGTSWNGGNGAAYFHTKWDDASPDNLVCTRKLPDVYVQYDIGEMSGKKFKPWVESELGISDWFRHVIVR